jgi:beta-glucanase (GH16 family)
VIKGNLRIEPDLYYVKSKTFVGKTVQSGVTWNKGLFRMRFKFPPNNNAWSTIYFFRTKANIDFVSQREKFSHDINTGVHIHSNTSFSTVEKHTSIHNMTHSFNEVSMEWTNEKIVWKLNDQHINEVNLKRLSSGNEAIDQIFKTSFRLIMALTLRREFYNDPNVNLNDIQKSYLDIDYIRVYEWRETEINTQSYPVTNNTMPTVVNLVAKNTMTFVVNPIAKNSVTVIIIPVLLVILVVLIIIAIVYWKLKMKHEINYSNSLVVYRNFPSLNEKL